MFARKAILVCILGSLALSQTACSDAGWLRDLDLGIIEQDDVEYVELRATLETQGLVISGLTVPIFDPRNPTRMIGHVTLKAELGTGQSELAVLVSTDYLESMPIPNHRATLPNGTVIPVAGVDAAKWIAIGFNGGGSRLYLNVDLPKKTAVIGLALSLDPLATGLVSAVLLPFQRGGISGVAGIYTGISTGQSGFALFVNASSLLENSVAEISFSAKTSASDAVRVRSKILQLERQGKVLRVH